MISVIIPLYNKGDKIRRTIESVLSQDYTDFEVIIIDDGSTDNSSEIAKSYLDKRVHYYYKENGGVSSARNYGIEVSNSEWLLFLDADDELTSYALSAFNKLHDRYPNCQYLVGMTKWIQNGVLISSASESDKMIISRHPFYDIWTERYYPATRNTLIHRSLIDKYGGFDERISFFEDWEFSLRLAECGCVAYIPKCIGIYNQDGSGLSFSSHSYKKDMAYYINVYNCNASFFKNALLFENIEMTKFYYPIESDEYHFYEQKLKEQFPWYYQKLHCIRQKIIGHNLMSFLQI